MLLPHRRHRDRRQRQGAAGLVPASPRPRSTSTTPSTRRSTTRSTSTSPTRRAGRAPASPSSSARSRRAGWSRASTRRWPPQGPPPRDHAHRPGGRRPPALGRGARRRCRRGRPASAAARPQAVRDLAGGFSPGATAVLDWPGARHLRQGGRRRAEPRVARLAPARGRGVGGAAAVAPSSRACSTSTTTATGWRWPSRRSTAARRRIRGTPASWHAAVRALDALHARLTPNPVPSRRAGRRRLPSALRRLGRAGRRGGRRRGSTSGPRRHLDRLAELESDWPDAVAGATLLHCDVRSDNIARDRAASSSSTGRTPLSARRSSTWWRGRRRWCSRAGPRPRSSWPVTRRPRARRPRRRRPSCSPPSAASSCAHSLRPPPPGLPTLRPLPGRPGRGGAGLAPAPDRLVTAGTADGAR